MLLRSLKIASASGHRWAGVFRRLGASFAFMYQKKAGLSRTKVDVFEGFLVRHSLSGGRVTTRVVDTNGVLLGITDGHAEPNFLNPMSTDYLWPSYERDVFAPQVPVPGDLEPKSADTLFTTGSVYGGVFYEAGTAWAGGNFTFTTGCPQSYAGIGVSTVASNTNNPSGGGEHAVVYQTTQLAGVLRWITDKRFDVTKNLVVIAWYENGGIGAAMPNYRLAPRMYPALSFDANQIFSIVRLPRQLALPSCVRDRHRYAGVFSVTTSPARTAFEYACGTTGLFVSFLYFSGANTTPTLAPAPLPANGFLPAGVNVQAWSLSVPWRLVFENDEEVTWFNPQTAQNEQIIVTVEHRVLYPPGGQYADEGIAFDAFMPNSVGTPAMVLLEDRVEIYTDYRIARSWLDTRDGIYPGLPQLSMQTQTGIVRINIPYTRNAEDNTYQVGGAQTQAVITDASGPDDASFAPLGPDRPDFHRLYRLRWAGRVGNQSVALASVVKHLRWEEPPENPIAPGEPILPNLAATQLRRVAQSGINTDYNSVWHWSYETPDNETVTGQKTYNGYPTVRLPGDAGTAGQWEDALGVALIVDGAVVQEWDCSTLGWALFREPTAARLREDDWRWESTAHNWAASISDSQIVVCAYNFPPSATPACSLLLINVLTGGISLLRTDPLPSPAARPAITCYQRYVTRTGTDIEACLIYRLGHQVEAGGWMDLSKDGGFTWHRIWEGPPSPGMGATYVGSQLWTPAHGRVFN